MKAELTGGNNQPLETCNTETLTRLPADSIHNDFAYKVQAAPTASSLRRAQWRNVHPRAGGNIALRLSDVDGRSSSLRLAGADESS